MYYSFSLSYISIDLNNLRYLFYLREINQGPAMQWSWMEQINALSL